MTRVLVAYATKMGSTKDIAEAIGDELNQHGLKAEVRNVREAVAPDFYDAVVFGTSVYAARWRPEAKRYFGKHTARLSDRPVWIFESGWIGNRPDVVTASPAGRRRAATIGAEPPVLFGGRLDPELATGLLDRTLAKRMPGDFRDFEEIRTWAKQIAEALATNPEGADR